MVACHIDDRGIARIQFETAQQNALSSSDLAELARWIDFCSEEEKVSVILLSSAGEQSFCAGANFKELISIKTLEESRAFFSGFGKVILAIRDCNKLVVGRVHGKAVGGGVGLAAACDYVLASAMASVRLSELNIGLGPFVIGPMVERKLGLSGFSSLSLNPKIWRTAQWAMEKGLYNDVFESIEQLDKNVEVLVDELSQLSSQAKTAVKKMIWEGTEHWTALMDERARMSGQLLLTQDCQDQIHAFLQKSR